jgi:CBS domain-containing protein
MAEAAFKPEGAVPAGAPHPSAVGHGRRGGLGPDTGLSGRAEDLAQAPLLVPAQATVEQVARAMTAAEATAALVPGDPIGIVTDSDLRSRVLSEGLPPETPAAAVMTAPVRSVEADAPLSAVLLMMLDEDVHHVPVIRNGAIVGLVRERDLLRRQLRSPLVLMARLRRASADEALAGYSAEVAGIAAGLVADGMEALRVSRVIASLNDALTRRLLDIAEQELGPAPCPYAWFALGSQGRMEPLLSSDADNALAYADHSPAADAYFAALAERVVGGLLRAGLPPCPGGCMATSWRKSLQEWESLFASWILTPEPRALLAAEEFLDFRRVHGELETPKLEEILQAGASRQTFLVQLARPAVGFRPPLRAFGRLRRHHVDLKLGGIAAIVLLGRLYAFAAGSRARSTPERLDDAVAAGSLTRSGADALIDALRVLTRYRLRVQLEALAAGEEPTDRIAVHDLSVPERRRLRDALREIIPVQELTALRYRTDIAS